MGIGGGPGTSLTVASHPPLEGVGNRLQMGGTLEDSKRVEAWSASANYSLGELQYSVPLMDLKTIRSSGPYTA